MASLNDMKDMLASLPQFQEQRERVSYVRRLFTVWELIAIAVLFAFEHGSRVYGDLRTGQTASGG